MPETLTPRARAQENERIINTNTRKPRPDQRAVALSYMVDNLATLIPEARQVLAWRRAQATGYPTGTGEPSVQGGGGTTSVEAAILVRDQTEADLTQIVDDMDTITVMVTDMTRMLRKIVGRQEQDKTHCHGGRGAEWVKLGSLVWGDETCEEKIHARGLCNAHYVAARRYAIAKGLEWLDRTPTEN